MTPSPTVAYDANGNTLSDPSGKSYTWDFENRLTQAVVPGTNGGTTTFKYDPFGRRIQKSGPLGTTNYLYDGDNLIEETDNSGAVLTKYTGENEIDEPLAEVRSGTTSYYHQDGQGSISALSNPAGTMVNTYTYDSFGKLTNSTGSISNPLQYTAREFDSETQLYFNRTRYRDPATGHWLNEDPIRFLGGHNFYSYVLNNPLKYRDPLGWQNQMPSCYPDCVHTPEEQQQIARENYEWHERTFGPPPVPGPPPPSGCKCKKKEVEMTTEKQFETMVRAIHIVETAGNVVVGAGIFVGSVGATVYFCTETAWIGCLALGIEIIPVPSYAGYELARGSIDELDEMSVEEDCQ